MPQNSLIQIISQYKKDPFLKEQFEGSAGAWENYTVEQHAIAVMTQFEKYFSGQSLPLDMSEENFLHILALHDIGKPLAILEGSKKFQHHHNSKIIQETLTTGNWPKKLINIAVSLVGYDPVGQYLKTNELAPSVEQIKLMAKLAEADLLEYFDLLLIYYQCDIASYTQNAMIDGIYPGTIAFDYLFNFNNKHNKLSFAPDTQIKIDKLRSAL